MKGRKEASRWGTSKERGDKSAGRKSKSGGGGRWRAGGAKIKDYRGKEGTEGAAPVIGRFGGEKRGNSPRREISGPEIPELRGWVFGSEHRS